MMATSISRSRSSTLEDGTSGADELRSQLQVLRNGIMVYEREEMLETLHQKLEAGHCIRQSLLESPDNAHIKDTFRHLNGFQTVIVALRHASQICALERDKSDDEHMLLINFLRAVFWILTAALQEHKGNQRFFRQRVEAGGWLAMKDILQPILLNEGKPYRRGSEVLRDEVLGSLLGAALNDESATGFFTSLKRSFGSQQVSSSKIDPERAIFAAAHNTEISAGDHVAEPTALVGGFLEKGIQPLTVIQNPDAALLMFDLWKSREVESPFVDSPLNAATAIAVVPRIINYLAGLSIRNLVALHGTGLLSSVLGPLLKYTALEATIASELRLLAIALLKVGVANLDDAQLLFQNARSSPLIAELLLISLKTSRSPSYIHFDLSLNGFASIELPGIGRSFPPTSSSPGYSLSLWFQIAHFDPKSHTTIFGAFDSSQTCFVLVYLEKDTHSLILQTSVSSSRPSVRFKLISFKEQRWYHIVIAHRRPKTTSSSRASLFVDGEFVEQVRSQYPATPPSTHSTVGSIASPSSSRRNGAVQAFLGTPQDLASHLGKGLVSTQWRLASANLFADVLSDDLIAVYYELGPRYTGNYQDCLGSFQTYQASAALNLRNESLHPGKEEKSDIVTAIRSKAGALLPESNILLNISANVVLDDDDQNNIDETHLLKFISKAAGKNLRNVTRGGRNALAINGAIPSVNEALLHSSGFAVLTGDPIVVVPQSLDDAAWRIGGCVAVGLALLDAAHESDDILRALNILFESVHHSWRNSEAMERENGFGVLSTLLSAKLSLLTTDPIKGLESPETSTSDQPPSLPISFRVLGKILEFVGYRTDKPEDSVINNALAYRILLVDMDYWRSAEPLVQKLYYEQFVVFGIRSKFHVFNTKRLSRMRTCYFQVRRKQLADISVGISKKWLEALKGETFTSQTFGYFLKTFKTMLTKSVSADSMRSLALYITYAIHKPRQTGSTPLRGKSMKLNTELSSRRKTLGSFSPRPIIQQNESAPQLTQMQIALKILELYTDLLCEKGEFTNINKFARTVTNKVGAYVLEALYRIDDS